MRKKILITAGPTREMLDPVRYLSNLSTGEMGYALAEAARRRGYQVTLISGPTGLPRPKKVGFRSIVSADQMRRVCKNHFEKCDVLIMTAAVCDFTARQYHAQKIHRTRIKQLHLKRTPDIVAGLARKKGSRLVIGFCLETQDWLKRAHGKLKRKCLDGIVANYYSPSHIPFGRRKINTALIDKKGRTKRLRRKSKRQVALSVLSWVESMGA